jgi:prevent-host-death family protein
MISVLEEGLAAAFLIMYICVHMEAAMISTSFTEFRKKAASFLDIAENGGTVIITRRGRPVAEIVPPSQSPSNPSWKRPALRMKLKGIDLTQEILKDRAGNRS